MRLVVWHRSRLPAKGTHRAPRSQRSPKTKGAHQEALEAIGVCTPFRSITWSGPPEADTRWRRTAAPGRTR
jgi:hypothetical protein